MYPTAASSAVRGSRRVQSAGLVLALLTGMTTALFAVPANAGDDQSVQLRNAGAGHINRSRLVAPAFLDLGPVAAGYQMPASTSRRLMFTNTGPDPIETSQVEIVGSTWFSIGEDTCSSRSIPAGQACSVQVHYTAKGPDVFDSASLTMGSDAANGQITVPMLGEGGDASPDPFPEISDDVRVFAIDNSRGRFTDDGAGAVVLSRDDVFADSLGGSVLTSVGPLLFSDGESLDTATQTEMDRVLAPGATVYLLGGSAVVSLDIESSLTGRGYTVVRLAGESRVETSVAVAQEAVEVFGTPDEMAVARADAPSENPTAAWADAVAAGGWAADTGGPILLTPTSNVHPAVEAFLESRQSMNLRILGGPSAISTGVEATLQGPDRVVRRIAGLNRFATAAAVAEAWGTRSFYRLIAPGGSEDGWAFTLALAGSSGDSDSPILLTELDRLPPETCAALGRINSLQTPTERTSEAVRTALRDGC